MDVKEKNRLRMRERRAEAKAAGVFLKSDSWFFENREKHVERTRRYREQNREKMRLVSRNNQAKRRSTPWGAINNRIWSLINVALKRGSEGAKSKYCQALGYSWLELKKHLESQFSDGMTWQNWGTHWELDHIKPVKGYRYESIQDESFKECWSLANLRPLERHKNIARTRKYAVEAGERIDDGIR